MTDADGDLIARLIRAFRSDFRLNPGVAVMVLRRMCEDTAWPGGAPPRLWAALQEAETELARQDRGPGAF